MIYDLNTLLARARRMGGDEIDTVHELVIGDGTRRTTLVNTGNIEVTEVLVDDEPLDPDTYESEDNIITFDDAQIDGSELNVTYRLSQYDDNRMLSELEDAARTVGGDLRVRWRVPGGSGIIDDVTNELFVDGEPDMEIETLIVVRCGLQIIGAKAGAAADDAIAIKDGDTAFDTSKGSGAVSGRARVIQDEYDRRLFDLRNRRFFGDIRSQ